MNSKRSKQIDKISNSCTLLIFFIVFAVKPFLASAQINYALDGDVAYVAESPNVSGNIVIATTYNAYPVAYIGNSAFIGCSNLTGVTIPNSITNIGNDAFYSCTNLVTLTFGNSVESIGDSAFYGCERLANVVIPDSVTSIGWFAFSGCTGLTSVTIGNGIASQIGAFAVFNGCVGLRSVTLGSGVNMIDGLDFHNLPSLTNITVVAANPNFSSLDGILFDKMQATLIAFPEGRVGSYAIPSGVTYIGNNAFYFCTSLTSVTLPKSGFLDDFSGLVARDRELAGNKVEHGQQILSAAVSTSFAFGG